MKFNCKYSKSHTGKPTKPVPVQIGLSRRNSSLILVVNQKKSQDKYTINSANIREIHSKFKKKGKATIEFKNPEFMILISDASPLELDKALRLISLAARGESTAQIDIDNELSSVIPILKKKDLKLSENITDVREYPKTEGFSASLQELRINTHRMKSVDIRWFALKHLTFLDLSNNVLGKMDEFDWKKFNRISKLTSLTTLLLDNNGFTELPVDFVQSLPKSLEALSLNRNGLVYLPDELCDLPQLMDFAAEYNPLEELPEDFFHMCRRIRSVRVSDTNIITHPSTLRNFRLELFRSSAIGNNFTVPERPKLGVGSLFSIASAKVYDYRSIFYSLPPTVRWRMREGLFRCDHCYRLYPVGSKKAVIVQPISASAVATNIAVPQGRPSLVNLLDSTCVKCYSGLTSMQMYTRYS